MTGALGSFGEVSSFVAVPLLVAAGLLLWVTPVPASRLRAIIRLHADEPAAAMRAGGQAAMPASGQVGGRTDQWRQRADQWRHRAMLGASATVALWIFAGPVFTVAVLAGVALAVIMSVRAKARRDEAAIRHAVYELCRAVAGELRIGSTPAVAFKSGVAASPEPLCSELAGAAEFVGEAEPAEFADLLACVAASRAALVGLARLAACWRVVVATGAMLAPAIDRVADALRDEIDLGHALATSLAAPRATVRLLAALPLLGLALGVVIGAHPVTFLLGSPAGLCCLLLAGVFDVAGVVWAGRIASRAAGSRVTGFGRTS